MPITLDGTNGITQADQFNSDSTFGFKNRIINGAMVIDQRNAGASVTPADGEYTLDRYQVFISQASKFSVQQDAGSVTPPVGFTDYLGVTSLSAYTVGAAERFVIRQPIEGFNIADLGWGTANAKTVTLSFWVRSSLTGTFGGSLKNSANDRSYPYTYTISVADTWEQKSVTIAGDTSGTWLTTNGVGIRVQFSLGTGSSSSGTAGAWAGSNLNSATGAVSVVGTNGATFYITGVQLEVGSTATSFDYRPYGTELALCQRYYYRWVPNAAGARGPGGFNTSTTVSYNTFPFPVSMRVLPTALETTGTATDYQISHGASNTACSIVPSFSAAGTTESSMVLLTVASGLTTGQGSQMRAPNTSTYLGWSAEL